MAWLPHVGRRSIIMFVALVVLLLAPWPGYGRTFGVLFSGYANGVVRIFGIDGISLARFTPEPAAPRNEGGTWTVALCFRDAGDHDHSKFLLDTRILGYTPLAIFLALTLSSAISMRRKGAIFRIGFGLLMLRLAIAIALPVARITNLLPSGSPFSQIAEVGWSVLIDQPAMSYAAPMLAWWIGLTATTHGSEADQAHDCSASG